MALHEHVESLRAKHHNLEAQIAEEMHRPLPDHARVSKLKKEKLRLKEEIERMEPATNEATTTPLSVA